jgi:NADH-quinone oxidoreductase subunit J
MTILIGCLILLGLMVLAIGALRDLLYAAVALAVASVALSIVLFSLGANTAAAFELSVCAGLITVLFVSTVSLTKDSDQQIEHRWGRILLLPAAAAAAAGAWFLVSWLADALPAVVGQGAGPAGFPQTFWGLRATDILAQLGIVLAGVLGILAVLRTNTGRQHD